MNNDLELKAQDLENSEETAFNEDAGFGEGDSQAEDSIPPVEEPLMDPPMPVDAEGSVAGDMTEVSEESLDDTDSVEEGASVANEVAEEGPIGDPVASADSETPVGDAISDAEALGAMEGLDGSPIGDAGLTSEYKEGADGGRDQSHSEKSQQDKTHSDRNKDHSDSQRENGAAGESKSLNSSSQGGESKIDQSKSLSKNSASGQTTNNQSATTNETDASKASQESKVAAESSSDAKSLSQVSKAGNTTNVDAKEKSGQTKTNSDKGKAKDSKRESRISKVRQSMTKQNVVGAVGKGLQGLGGQMVGSENQGKDALKMMGAGALHAAGGLTGTQRVTTRTAQNQIDKRNERLRRAGKDVPDNLSAVGETREQARKRTDDRIRSQDDMMAAQMSQDYDKKKDNEAKERGRRAAEARKKRSEGKN